MPERKPAVTSHTEMLSQWASTLQRGLEAMLSDARAGKLLDDTLERDFDYIRHLMNRRGIIVNEIMKASSRHRGPGTPLYIDLEGGDGHVDH